MVTKKKIKNMSIGAVLRLIYEHQINDAALQHKSKEDLQYFIIEIFDKGILNDYLKLTSS